MVPIARATMLIAAAPARIAAYFCDPELLKEFWLESASGTLEVGKTVDWNFKVPGATIQTSATQLEDDRIEWDWSDGTHVSVDIEDMAGGSAVTVEVRGFDGDADAMIDAAINTTEGFAIVLCDLKTCLENGKSAGLTKAKARLIQARA